MGKAGKIIIGVIVVLILVVGGAVTYLVFNVDTIVARVIETAGSRAAGVPVTVGGVSISLREARGEINRLTVGNPKGFSGGNALELRQIALALDVNDLSAERVHVKSVLVDGAKVNAVQGAKGNNLQAILDNLKSEQPASGGQSEGTGTKVIIDDFQFRDGAIGVTLPALGERTGKIPDIRLQGIGQQSNGVTAAEAAQQILEPIIRQSLTAMTKVSKEDLEKMGREKLDDALGQGAEKAQDALGKLLGGKKD